MKNLKKIQIISQLLLQNQTFGRQMHANIESMSQCDIATLPIVFLPEDLFTDFLLISLVKLKKFLNEKQQITLFWDNIYIYFYTLLGRFGKLGISCNR